MQPDEDGRTGRAVGELPGSHALPPSQRVDFNVIIRPGAAGLIGKAGDDGLGWREQVDPVDLVFTDDRPAHLGNISAEDSLDLLIGCAEFVVLYSRDQRKRAYALRLLDATKAIREGTKDMDGRAIPLGRLIGVQPASGTTAAQSIGMRLRNTLLRDVRCSVSEWRHLSANAAASAMIHAFDVYRVGSWLADQYRETRPATDPNSFFWRLLRLGVSKPMPNLDRLADIIGEIDDGESGGT